MPYAIKIACNYRGYNLSLDDLISEAYIGLIKAADNFNPKHKVPFPAYACYWIKSQVRSFVMNNLSIVKIANTQTNRRFIFGSKQPSTTKSPRGIDTNFEDYLEHDTRQSNNLEEEVIHMQNLAKLKPALNKLQQQIKPKHWQVFSKRYLSDQKETLSKIGKMYDLSPEGVRKIEMKTLNTLRGLFQENM